MNVYKLASIVALGASLMTSTAFADQDYKARNVFNRISDNMAAMGKNAQDKEKIINDRIEQRAEKRKADAAVAAEKAKADAQQIEAKQKKTEQDKQSVSVTRKDATITVKDKFSKERADISEMRDNAKKIIDQRKAEAKADFEKTQAEVRKDNASDKGAMDKKLQDNETIYKERLTDLDYQWKTREDMYAAKEHALKTRIAKEEEGK